MRGLGGCGSSVWRVEGGSEGGSERGSEGGAPFILLSTEDVFLPGWKSKGNGALEATLKGNGENAVPFQSWQKTTDRVRRRRVFYFQAAMSQMKYEREMKSVVARERKKLRRIVEL